MTILLPFVGVGVGLLILIIALLLCLFCSIDNMPFNRFPSETTQNSLMPLDPTSSRQQDVTLSVTNAVDMYKNTYEIT